MRLSEIENWTLKIVDQVKNRQPIEDSRVELKAKWINPVDAARRIGGHANAARGESILWLIGVDEKANKIVGAQPQELTAWWPQVISNFDGIAPNPTEINVPVDGVTVVALLFQTDRAPFVVKNPKFGTQKEAIAWEVPWRGTTGVRTATRSDLIQMLVPILHVPEVEVLGCELTCCTLEGKQGLLWSLILNLYVTPTIGESVVFPFHRCKASFELPGIVSQTEFNKLRIRPPYIRKGSQAVNSSVFAFDLSHELEPDTIAIKDTQSEIMIGAPGQVALTGEAELALSNSDSILSQTASIHCNLVASHGERNVSFTEMLSWHEPTQNQLGKWVF